MNRSDIDSFFRALLLGDFEEEQNTSAQIVGGLISLVPILDQVLDARDITGALFNINKRGGFDHANVDQIVNLAFAAFGAIPEVGSAFKAVFKPLWKERRAVKGAVNGGLQAVEALLGMKKGGAVSWIHHELLGKWSARVTQAIAAVNFGLAACIEVTDFVATASGWKDWLIPDAVQAIAKELLPSLIAMQGTLDGPLRRGSDEIQEFLADLLGEQAATIVMAVGQKAVAASAIPGSRTRAGHNAAASHPQGHPPPRQPAQKVQTVPKADARHGGGSVHAVMQATRKTLSALASQEKGLIGEHVADYIEVKRLGGDWPHDKSHSSWSPPTVRKLNVDKRPVNLSLQDLPKVNHPGIDAVWEHGGQYTVTEAKASESAVVVLAFGKYKERKGIIPTLVGLGVDLELLHYILSDSSDKRGTQTPLMQMSKAWTRDRAQAERIGLAATAAVQNDRAARRVVLTTFEVAGAIDHAEALTELHLGKATDDMRAHTTHNMTNHWDAAAIDAVDKARVRAHEQMRPPSRPQDSSSRPRKARRPDR